MSAAPIDPRDHVGLCYMAAGRWGRSLGGDAPGVAYLALVKAADCYPRSTAAAKGYPFSSYAVFRLRSAFRYELDMWGRKRGRSRGRQVRTADPTILADRVRDRDLGPLAGAILAEELAIHAAPPPPEMAVRCGQCGVDRWPHEYRADRTRPGGRADRCKPCMSEREARWHRTRKAVRLARRAAEGGAA